MSLEQFPVVALWAAMVTQKHVASSRKRKQDNNKYSNGRNFKNIVTSKDLDKIGNVGLNITKKRR